MNGKVALRVHLQGNPVIRWPREVWNECVSRPTSFRHGPCVEGIRARPHLAIATGGTGTSRVEFVTIPTLHNTFRNTAVSNLEWSHLCAPRVGLGWRTPRRIHPARQLSDNCGEPERDVMSCAFSGRRHSLSDTFADCVVKDLDGFLFTGLDTE